MIERKDPDELRSEAYRIAEQARHLLDHPLLSDTLAALEAEYIAAWRGTPPDQPVERETAYFRLQALDQLKADLQSKLTGAKILEMGFRRRS